MKFSFNGLQVFELTELQKKVIQNDIPQEIFESDMIRRFMFPIQQSNKKQINEKKGYWKKELQEKGFSSVPSDDMKLAELYLSDKIPAHKKTIEHTIECNGNLVSKINMYQIELWKKDRGLENDSDAELKLCEEMCYLLMHKYEKCLERLKKEWEPNLRNRGIQEFPLDDTDFVQLVFSQHDYKNRSERIGI